MRQPPGMRSKPQGGPARVSRAARSGRHGDVTETSPSTRLGIVDAISLFPTVTVTFVIKGNTWGQGVVHYPQRVLMQIVKAFANVTVTLHDQPQSRRTAPLARRDAAVTAP